MVKRYLQVDFLRGLAIISMVIFHISFDLNNFHFIHIDIYNHTEKNWAYFRIVILTLFLTCVGISIVLTNETSIKFTKIFKRFFKIMSAAMVVSIASYFTFPQTWIYFGVLHFIALASVVAIVFINIPWFSLFFAIFIIVGYIFNYFDMHWLFNYFHNFINLPIITEDLVSFTPWFGLVLIGIFIGKKRLFLFPLQNNKITRNIAFLGKHALAIYLIHQPIFFGIIYSANYLLH